MTVIDWLISVDRSLLPIYSAAIILIGLYGYLKPEKEETQEPSYTEPQIRYSTYDGNIPPSTWSLRDTYFVPTIGDILQDLPSTEESAMIGIYRGHRVMHVNDMLNADSDVQDEDYVICGDSLYLKKNNELILIELNGEI